MRLIGSFENREMARRFYSLLMNEGIETLFEIEDRLFKIWVQKEDDVEKALKLLHDFKEKPHDTKFDVTDDVHIESVKKVPLEISEDPVLLSRLQEMRQKLSSKALYSNIEAYLTKGMIFLCAILFLIDWYQHTSMVSKGVAPSEISFSPLEKGMLYDDPHKVNALLGLEPSDEEKLVLEAKAEKAFIGYYYIALNWPLSKLSLSAPKFVSIKEGQLWRLFTPALLHGGILHILFNMMWLFVLGKQIEERMGRWRYLGMMLIIAAISNTAEYLMVGPVFLGFSGVICGLAGFIWMRQRVAPWEGYPLQRAASLFLAIFVLGIVALQVVSFTLKVLGIALLPIQIANTAHLVGAFVGIGLARIKAFARHS